MTDFVVKLITIALVALALAVDGYSQYPAQSPYDETYAPKSLRGLKALNVQGGAQIFIPMELLGSEIKRSDVKSRVEGMLKKAGISYLPEEGAELGPDAPVLSVRIVATKMESDSYPDMKQEGYTVFSKVIEVALMQKVTVENGSKLRITATTWLGSDISLSSDENPRESILKSVDYMVFEFIKAYMIGNSKSPPKIGRFFNIVNTDEPTAAEARPKNLEWGPPHKGLQMTAWPSPIRPVVFCAIRNASQRTIHYCDYLLGYFEMIRVHARPKGESEWTWIPIRLNRHRGYIGALLCGRNDSLGPGKEMPPNWSGLLNGAPKIKRKYTFTESLRSYDFPADWKGKFECKITQTIGGGRHEDAYEGTVESSIFEIDLPLASR